MRRYLFILLVLTGISSQYLYGQEAPILPDYLQRTEDINPHRKTQSYSWVLSDAVLPNGKATLTGRWEYWDTRHQTRSILLGMTLGPISDMWTLPSAMKEEHFHLRLGGEWRRYANYYPSFYGVKVMLLPQLYSRTNNVLEADGYHFAYSYARIRDLTTTISGVAGIRPKFSNRIFADITFELGLSYRRIRHVKYEDVTLTEPPSLQLALPNFINNALYDSSSKFNGGDLRINFTIGIALGFLKF